MASYQKHYDDQGRQVDEYGNVARQTDEHGNPIHAASVTYVAAGTAGGYGDTNKQHHDTTGVLGGDTGLNKHTGYAGRDTGSRQHGNTGRQHGTTGNYGIDDTDRKQHGITGTGTGTGSGGYPGGDTGRQQHGTTIGGPYYGTNTSDTGTGPRSGTIGGGTGYGINTGGAHTEAAGYGKEQRPHEQTHGDQHEKKGIMDKIKEKLPGGHGDNK